MAICPLCGCKTDELDFVLCKIEGTEAKVCSFCEKQIKKIDADEDVAIAQLRWLESILSKGIAREQNIVDALNSLKSKYFDGSEFESAAAPRENQFAEIKKDVTSAVKSSGTNISEAQYNDLVNRIERLEDSFAKYKKSQLIKMILELGFPIVLGIIVAIIFFASGLYDSLTTLTSMF